MLALFSSPRSNASSIIFRQKDIVFGHLSVSTPSRIYNHCFENRQTFSLAKDLSSGTCNRVQHLSVMVFMLCAVASRPMAICKMAPANKLRSGCICFNAQSLTVASRPRAHDKMRSFKGSSPQVGRFKALNIKRRTCKRSVCSNCFFALVLHLGRFDDSCLACRLANDNLHGCTFSV